jgi:hypothetical protein
LNKANDCLTAESIDAGNYRIKFFKIKIMKKNLLRAAFIAAFGLAVGYTAYSSQKDELALSETLLDNVEALAEGEINPFCPNGCVSGGGGCHCYIWYEHFSEYDGW